MVGGVARPASRHRTSRDEAADTPVAPMSSWSLNPVPREDDAAGAGAGAGTGAGAGAGSSRKAKVAMREGFKGRRGGGGRGAAGPIVLVAYVAAWYGLTALYSVYNKAVLQVFPFPLTVLTAELGAGVLLVLPAWLLGIVRTPSLRMSQMPMIFYVSLWHSLSNASAGAALRWSSLAVVTAVQALEPLASAAVDFFLAGERSHYMVNACLVPVIGGVILVAGDPSLTWGGLFFAVASSVAVGVRDLYSKRASRQKEFNKRPLSAANTYAVVTVMSFATVVPYACIVDGPRAIQWWGQAQEDMLAMAANEGHIVGVNVDVELDVGAVSGSSTLALYLAASGVLLFLHSAAAFLVLEKMGSVTAFSVSNAVKRGFIVSAAAAVMGPPLAHRSVVGAASAVVGTSAYWVARMYFPPRRRRKPGLQQ